MSDPGGDDDDVNRGVGGRTMQVDALVDADAVLEDGTADDADAEGGDPPVDGYEPPAIVSRAPPPLPKRGPKKSVVIVALGVVIVLSIVAAFGASRFLAPDVPVAAVLPTTVPEAPAIKRTPLTLEAIEIMGGPEEDMGPAEDFGPEEDADAL
jgi:hypothetical protein